MDAFTKYSNNVAGRDKAYRMLQYGSKLLGWYMEKHGMDKSTIKLLRELEKSMSTSRKLFRFGRSVEAVKAAQRALNLQNYILSVTLSLSHINKAFFLLLDHYIWLGRVGLLNVDLKKWSDSSYKFWLASLVFAFIRDFYALYVDTERLVQSKKFESDWEGPQPRLYVAAFFDAMKKNPQATMDMVKNGCDIVIPATTLGYFNFNNGVVGFCGLVSSVLAAMQVTRPALKLKPN